MKLAVYFCCSLLAVLATVYYAFSTRGHFYPSILFLVSSKVCLVVAGNMALATSLLVGKLIVKVFFGALRDTELELLLEMLKYEVMEIFFAFTLFRNEISGSVILLFGGVVFLKGVHLIAKTRVQYLEQVERVAPIDQMRLQLLILALLTVDAGICWQCVQHTMTTGKSVIILFGFEFGLLFISAINIMFKYYLGYLDSKLENGLPHKGLYIMLLELMCDALKVVVYIAFFYLIFKFFGMPLHILREVWISVVMFQRRLVSFMKYLKLVQNLDARFPDATAEEMAAAEHCLVCREAMESGKKLPCGHVFHVNCLRMWLQQQQACPLCRADIPADSTNPSLHGTARVAPAELARAAAEEDAAALRAAGVDEEPRRAIAPVPAPAAAAPNPVVATPAPNPVAPSAAAASPTDSAAESTAASNTTAAGKTEPTALPVVADAEESSVAETVEMKPFKAVTEDTDVSDGASSSTTAAAPATSNSASVDASAAAAAPAVEVSTKAAVRAAWAARAAAASVSASATASEPDHDPEPESVSASTAPESTVVQEAITGPSASSDVADTSHQAAASSPTSSITRPSASSDEADTSHQAAAASPTSSIDREPSVAPPTASEPAPAVPLVPKSPVRQIISTPDVSSQWGSSSTTFSTPAPKTIPLVSEWEFPSFFKITPTKMKGCIAPKEDGDAAASTPNGAAVPVYFTLSVFDDAIAVRDEPRSSAEVLRTIPYRKTIVCGLSLSRGGARCTEASSTDSEYSDEVWMQLADGWIRVENDMQDGASTKVSAEARLSYTLAPYTVSYRNALFSKGSQQQYKHQFLHNMAYLLPQPLSLSPVYAYASATPSSSSTPVPAAVAPKEKEKKDGAADGAAASADRAAVEAQQQQVHLLQSHLDTLTKNMLLLQEQLSLSQNIIRQLAHEGGRGEQGPAPTSDSCNSSESGSGSSSNEKSRTSGAAADAARVS